MVQEEGHRGWTGGAEQRVDAWSEFDALCTVLPDFHGNARVDAAACDPAPWLPRARAHRCLVSSTLHARAGSTTPPAADLYRITYCSKRGEAVSLEGYVNGGRGCCCASFIAVRLAGSLYVAWRPLPCPQTPSSAIPANTSGC